MSEVAWAIRRLFLLAGTGLLVVPFACGQESSAYVPKLTFDVVSIRESKPNADGSFTMGGPNPAHASMVSVTNFRATDLIGFAYGMDSRRIIGGPDWASSTRYNFQAKSDSSVDAVLAGLSDREARTEKEHMLQAVMAERFHLQFHRVTREATVYELVVAKGGPKMQASKLVAADGDDPKAVALANKPDMRQSCGPVGCEMTATRFTMQALAGVLRGQLNANVVDKTGLAGAFDLKLLWTGRDFPEPGDDGSHPQLLTAVQEQLGLQLRAAKGTIEELVIDHIEKPSEN